MARVTVTWKDFFLKQGLFSFLIADAYDDGVYAELIAFVQDLLDASECEIEKIQIARDVPISGLVGNVATHAEESCRIDDQAVLSLRSASNVDSKISIPAPLNAMFDAAGAYANQDVDMGDALVLAMIATGETVPLLVTKTGETLVFRKGWRKGQRHS